MNDQKLREQLIIHVRQGNAFTPVMSLLQNISYDITGEKIEGFLLTIWEITEHIRRALDDLVSYSRDSFHQSPPWPDKYWPHHTEPQSKKEWETSIKQIYDLIEEMISLIQNPSIDLFEPFKANDKHHLLRQATIVAEHNAYHAGQIAMLSKAIERRRRME